MKGHTPLFRFCYISTEELLPFWVNASVCLTYGTSGQQNNVTGTYMYTEHV